MWRASIAAICAAPCWIAGGVDVRSAGGDLGRSVRPAQGTSRTYYHGDVDFDPPGGESNRLSRIRDAVLGEYELKINTILDQIDGGSMALPEFQRGYVWNRNQVRGFMESMYRKYPVGSLLVWITKTDDAIVRGDGHLASGSVRLLLDGQQRITSLYGVIRGQAPDFFEGNSEAFSGLHFNLAEEVFEFYAPLKMKDNPMWVDVSDVMHSGSGDTIQRVLANPDLQSDLKTYISRLIAIESIKEVDLHIEEVAGEDKTIDLMVDIFNRLNSGGTKLSKGDLALARICAEWPDARKEMKKRLQRWNVAGFGFRLEWLLRNINAVVNGEALFVAFKDVVIADFKNGLTTTEKTIDSLLNMISGRLGLDHVLAAPFVGDGMAEVRGARAAVLAGEEIGVSRE